MWLVEGHKRPHRRASGECESPTPPRRFPRGSPAVLAAISRIDQAAWTPIRYPNAIGDDDEQRWNLRRGGRRDHHTAFTRRGAAEHVTARLIVRRVRRQSSRW